MLAELGGRLAALHRPDSPFTARPLPREHARGVQWVTPLTVGEVAYAELTPEGVASPGVEGIPP